MRHIQSPKQSRSQRTLELLLDAAEEVLAEKSFDEASVQEIVARAGFTVGAFYARFSDKKALLPALEQRLRDRVAVLFADLDRRAAASNGFEERLRLLVATAVEFYSSNRSALMLVRGRALASDEGKARTLALNREIHDALRAYVNPRDESIRHPFPDDAVDVALLMLFSTLREMLINGVYWPEVVKLDRSRMVDEITRALHIYLATPNTTDH